MSSSNFETDIIHAKLKSFSSFGVQILCCFTFKWWHSLCNWSQEWHLTRNKHPHPIGCHWVDDCFPSRTVPPDLDELPDFFLVCICLPFQFPFSFRRRQTRNHTEPWHAPSWRVLHRHVVIHLHTVCLIRLFPSYADQGVRAAESNRGRLSPVGECFFFNEFCPGHVSSSFLASSLQLWLRRRRRPSRSSLCSVCCRHYYFLQRKQIERRNGKHGNFVTLKFGWLTGFPEIFRCK